MIDRFTDLNFYFALISNQLLGAEVVIHFIPATTAKRTSCCESNQNSSSQLLGLRLWIFFPQSQHLEPTAGSQSVISFKKYFSPRNHNLLNQLWGLIVCFSLLFPPHTITYRDQLLGIKRWFISLLPPPPPAITIQLPVSSFPFRSTLVQLASCWPLPAALSLSGIA